MKSSRAKVLHEILGRPLGYYPLHCALQVGANPVVAVIGHQAEEVQKTMESAFADYALSFASQKNQLGTAHAVLSTRQTLEKFSGDIFILHGDTPLLRTETLKALAQAKKEQNAPLALVTTCAHNPQGYGRIVRSQGCIERIVEEKDCTIEQRGICEVNAAIYLVDSNFLWSALEQVSSANAQQELYLTDLAFLAFKTGKPAASIEVGFEETAGVNDRIDLAQAAAGLRQRINQRHMAAGVTLEDPYSIHIDDSVQIGQDSLISPGCIIQGMTSLGQNVTVGPGCVVHDSEIADNAQLRAYCVLENAKVGAQALIGPFARLRPGTDLANKVHIGNFVETKKAKIGEGSKANHLTYLGDCEIGTGVNIGAGTITCNYDGVHKHKTEIGDGVFVGSDSQFVAPIKVGKGAYIAAGSTITKDVPEESLAIARSRQTTKTDYLRKKRGESE